MTRETRRRWFLRSTALAAAAGVAGCSGNSESPDEEGDDEGDEEPEAETTEDTPEAMDTATERDPDPVTETDQSTPVQNPRETVENWLSGTQNFSGNIVNRTGDSSVSIEVGARTPNGNYFGYGPAAIRVSAGTTVQWQWSGNGGAHSVTERNGAFDSGQPESGAGVVFNHEFDEQGVYLYRCRNHGGAAGMRGAVIVGRSDSLSGYPEVDNWLSGYEAYDGRLTDERGTASLEITVGAQGNGGNFAFRPIAPLVSAGTEITFRWSGRGGGHDVTWNNVDLPNSETTSAYNNTYSVTLEESGVYLYRCDNHTPSSGRGAIVVA